MTCAWFELLCRIPFAGWRLRVCRRHTEHCPRCLHASETIEMAPRLIRADRLPPGLDLWPGVRRGIAVLPGAAASPEVISPQARRSWRWAYAAAMLLLAFFAGYLAFFFARGTPPLPSPVAQIPGPQTRLHSAKIGDQPARIFRIQSRNPDCAIFWIAKENTRG